MVRTDSQAQTGVNFDFEVKFDLEGQGQSTPKTIGILTKVFYTYGQNLVILAWTGNELSRGQTCWWTDGRTDGQTHATTIPEGQNWPRVKTRLEFKENIAYFMSNTIVVADGSSWRSNEAFMT